MHSDGSEAATGEVGELWVLSATNMQSYYNLPEESAKNLTDGWVHTGDAGTIDEDEAWIVELAERFLNAGDGALAG